MENENKNVVVNTKSPNQDDFYMSIEHDDDNNEVVLVTSHNDKLSKYEENIMWSAIENYDRSKGLYSAYLADKTDNSVLTPEYIDELANGIQTDMKKVLSVNAIIRNSIMTNDIIGKTYESIESNVNTDIKLSYGNTSNMKEKTLKEVKSKIDIFNKQIRLKQLIKESIPLTYAEGNYILCLRTNGINYIVDHYPIGVATISQYTYGGKNVVEIDIEELKTRLKKTYSKTKKNKAIFFENIEKDIQANYPKEVYTAYKNKEKTVRLDTKYTGVMRIGNLGRAYGVSPILRALKSSLMLSNFENSDYTNTKAKAKKIIHQVMRKETMGADLNKSGITQTIKAHDDLMQAWKNKTVVYTSTPQVEKIVYVEPKVDDTSAEKINIYRSKIMSTLGVGFIDSNNSSFSTGKISLDQLLKTINSISQQLEDIIQGFYEVLFENENIDFEYLPTLQILDSEAMDFAMKKELADLLYSKLNCSLESSLGVFGYNIEDEKYKRITENNDGISDIFTPRLTSYTASGSVGRNPSSDNKDKQAKDKEAEIVRK